MSENKTESPGKLKGSISISIICFFVFSLGFLPIIIGGAYVVIFIPFDQIWHFLLIPVIIYVGIVVTLFYQILFSGIVIHIFNIKYEPGVYEYTYNNKMAYRWSIVCSLYTPLRKLIEILPVGRLDEP